MARKLKVFEARLGFYDTVLAAQSQAAALRIWGTNQNLFADGVARPASDPAAIEAALAAPETLLRRAVGTNDPYGLHPGLPHLPEEPKVRTRARPGKPKVEAKAPPRVERSALDAAQAALEKVDADHGRAAEVLAERRAALEADERELRERHDSARQRATSAVDRERRAYVKAGGRL